MPSTRTLVKFGWLPLVISLGILLRVVGIGSQSLWIDEVATSRLVSLGSPYFPGELFGTTGSEANQPLYFLLMHPWTRAFGTSEWALRAPSMLFGVVAILVFFLWCKETVGELAARLATLLLATSAFAVWYSQDARPYSLVLLVACAIHASFSRYMRDRKIASLIALACIEVVAFHTSILLGGLLAFVNVYWLVRGQGADSYRWVATQAAVAVLCVPFAMLNIMKVAGGAHTQAHADITVATIYGFWTLLVGFGVGPSAAELHEQAKLQVVLQHLGEIIPIAIIVLICAWVAFAWLRRIEDRLYWMLAVFVPALFVIAVFASLKSTPLPRYWVVCLPAMLAILGAAFANLRTWPMVLATTLLVAVNLISIGRVGVDPQYMKEDYRALADHLTHVRRDALVFVIGPTTVLEYYGARRLIERKEPKGDQASSDLTELALITSPYWLVVDRARAWDWDPHARLRHLMVPKGARPERSYSNVDLYFVEPKRKDGKLQ